MSFLTFKFILLSALFPVILISQNINISQGNIFDGEPYIAVNPDNSQHIVIAWMGYKLTQKIAIKVKASFDGGKSWSNESTLKHDNPLFTSADPSIDFGPEGDVYISYIDFSGFDVEPIQGGIYISKSSDGGLNWKNPVLVLEMNSDPGKRPIDRPWINVDRSQGDNKGNIYITSMNAKGVDSPPYHPYISVSTDGGSTFNWKYLDSENWLAGNVIAQPMATNALTSDGIFYAVYPSYVLSQNILPQYILAKSIDGANTFTYNTAFASASTVNDPNIKRGYLISVDPSDSKHLIFLHLTNNSGNIDVGISESFNEGKNWHEFNKINDDNSNAMQDMAWGDFNDKGDYVVTWRDRRKAPNNSYANPYEFWATVKYKDSLSFSKNFRISDTIIAFDDILLKSGNDFMNCSYIEDTLYSVWGDTRNGKLNIWFHKTTIPDKNINLIKKISSESNILVKIYPNPTSSNVVIEAKDIIKITIYDINGDLVKNIKYNFKTDRCKIENLYAGIYILKVETAQGKILKKLVIM